jgi:hypothetical protein
MFSGFTQLFGRDFAVGYFLPTIMFATVSALLFLLFMPQATTDAIGLLANQLESIWTVSVAVFGIWTLSILLMVLNRGMVRTLEGYGLLQRTPLRTWQLHRFDRLHREITRTAERYKEECERLKHVSPQTEKQYTDLSLRCHADFPQEREFVLATSFGNVIRAFETYSRVMYGLDSIPGWTRIIAVAPDGFRATLNGAKAQVDFAVNIVYLAMIVGIQYVVYAVVTESAPMIWIPPVALAVTILAYRLAVSSAREWGEYVKAVFDLYRHPLLKQMGLQVPLSWQDEYHWWQDISRAFLYEDRLDLPKNVRGDSAGGA